MHQKNQHRQVVFGSWCLCYKALTTVGKVKLQQRTYLNKVQPENTNLSGSITVHLNSCLFCLDSTALLMFSQQHLYFFVKSKPVKQVSRTGILPSMVSVVLELPMSISLSLQLRRRTGSPDRSFLCHPFFILILNEMFSVNYAQSLKAIKPTPCV